MERSATSARSSARARTASRDGRLFDGYLDPTRPYAGAYDEMFAPDRTPRQAYRRLHESLAPAAPAELGARAEALDRALVDQGITFSLSGQERPFPLDLIPRVITASEWARLERGIVQRVKALEAFLADVYGDQQIIRDGVLPKRLITSCDHFHRQAARLTPPNGVRVHVAGIDVVRDEDGVFRVLEDNLRSPSGVSYVMENRRTMARVFPDLFAKHRVRAVGDYAVHLLRALRAAAAANVADPNVVVLTPGVHNSAYFEHSLLARLMGVELVEGRDLFCRDNAVYMRTTQGERAVDVVYRRIDDEFLDPVHFKPDSVLGVAGLLNAARAGNVVIANAVGNGVADDKLVYTYLPDILKYYLGESLLLPNVDTFRCWLPDEQTQVLDRLDELVVKPVEGSGGYGIVFGPSANQRELAMLRRRIRNNPRGWIAQPVVQLSTVPTKVGQRLKPRHVDLRPFAVNDGRSVFVLPGGLTRVALPEGSLIVNSSQGGGSKDTWVLAARSSTADAELAGPGLAGGAGQGMEDIAPERGPELTLGQQQQQQQQGVLDAGA
ncbi:MAG: circularly permuted type 2 ATP-grasp protein [Actinophytocola sp.]|uniref:circularly permuted type 2 ATP-grasp protein n=1 Tax=Actinophytocola sp. TaxID=1872138 RepID=UPI0013264E3D|nr:circularly permuted type 2 ATP-grasp protein [Actinophytocola sp.]MPZ81226.1 circularly permuted type 2 ATP-grasp protein [Actinophytocola sp.]